MSSRALRKLHGDAGDPLEQLALEDDDSVPVPVKSKKKKHKPPTVNPFDLLNEDDDNALDNSVDNDDKVEEEPENDSQPSVKPKKKKKKKKKGKSDDKTDAPNENEEKDDFEAALKEVNEMLGELPTRGAEYSGGEEMTYTSNMRHLLSVEHRNLNPDNEMKKMFGSRVVQGEPNRRRGRKRNVHHRSTWLTTPKDTWPHMTKTGLSMRLEETRAGGVQYFAFEHNSQYQKTQWEFLDAVESMQPEAIMRVLNVVPYHIDSLLQLSEVCKMSDDTQMATELIERALYAFEYCFHPSFSLTQGTCRLDYKRPENRAFYLALFRHLVFIGQKGCYRTSLEFCKLILSLDPDGDPLCMLLLLDFYALRASEFSFLVRMSQEWEAHRNLSQLPNFAFSIPLAMFHLANKNGESTEEADAKLQEALIMFPGLLIPLLDRCNVVPDPKVEAHPYFGSKAQTQQAAALKQLVALYAGRCVSAWKEPEVLTWLERACHRVMERVDAGDEAVTLAAQRRKSRYQGTPRNIYRHIVISEIKEAMTTLPPDITGSSIMSYDPLPPPDSIVSYERPHRARRAEIPGGGTLSMFLRSLLPNFNPQEIVDPEEAVGAAGGGGELQRGVGTLMDAMRELLANIQPVPPPREDQHGGEGGDAGEDGEWEEWD